MVNYGSHAGVDKNRFAWTVSSVKNIVIANQSNMNKQAYLGIVEREIQKGMDVMFPHGAGRATHTYVRHWLETIAKIAFSQGGNYALMSLLTVEDVAERFNVTPRRVRAIAKNRHERFGVGWQVPGTNQWLFRPEELTILEPDQKYRHRDS